jgi:hypothetical protein
VDRFSLVVPCVELVDLKSDYPWTNRGVCEESTGGQAMQYAIGVMVCVAVAAFAALSGFDRERAFYPTVLIVTASYYVLFAAMGASTRTLIIEGMIAGVFLLCAVIGFKTNYWLVAAALVGHGALDLVHRSVIDNAGVPPWWPGFCLAFDVALAAWLAVRQIRGRHFFTGARQ